MPNRPRKNPRLFDEASRQQSEKTDSAYADTVDARNRQIYLSLENDGQRQNFMENLPKEERRALKELLGLK